MVKVFIAKDMRMQKVNLKYIATAKHKEFGLFDAWLSLLDQRSSPVISLLSAARPVMQSLLLETLY